MKFATVKAYGPADAVDVVNLFIRSQALLEGTRNVQTLIEEAFVGIRRDEDRTLHRSRFNDTFGDFAISDATWNRQRNAGKVPDSETEWRDVPTKSIDACDTALSYATQNAGGSIFQRTYVLRGN